MSFDFNYKLWLTTKKDLQHLIKRQNILKNLEPIEDPNRIFVILSQIYILYIELVHKLGYLYAETFQVQKKEVLRNLAQPAILRLLELKNALREIELNEYVYLNKTLIERKLTPYDLLIWNSSFRYNRAPDKEAELLKSHRYTKISHEDIVSAVIKLQAHERARKARLLQFALVNKKLTHHIDKKLADYTFNHKTGLVLIPIKRTIFHSNFILPSATCEEALDAKNTKETDTDDHEMIKLLEKAALTIQTAWRRYKSMKLLKMKMQLKQSIYGMRKPKKLQNPKEYQQNILQNYKKYIKQNQLNKDYNQLMTDERTRLLQEYKPQIMEDISDHIRDWFREFYEKTGDFHPFPEVSKSGTNSLLTNDTMTLEEFKAYLKEQDLSKEEKKNTKEKFRLQQQKEKEKIKKEQLKQLKLHRKLKSAGIYDIGNELKSNKNVEKIEKIFLQFSTDWQNVDEYLNKQHDAIKEWVTETELASIHKELRILVDSYMRLEYNLLKYAWAADNSKKFKPTKTREKKILHKTHSKKMYDLTVDRTVESLYEELRKSEIIDMYPETNFEDYLGDFNFVADDFRNGNNISTLNPSKADIKLVIQDILFGMGAFDVEKTKGVCLIGPVNNGKKMLCHVIASELGALFINLSPERTFSFAKNLKYFIHVIMKVAKAFQPTIIFIQEAHRVFWKKVPKDQKDLQPTLLRNVLIKDIIKSIGKQDKIMVVGTSSLPWTAAAKFKNVFQKLILVPESDYGTVFLTWLQLLTQNVNGDYLDDTILSVLAKVCQKYNTGDITDNVTSSLNLERRMQLHSNPLNPNEFLDYFLKQANPLFPTEKKVSEKYKEWYYKSSKYRKLKLTKQSKKRKDK